MNWVIKCYCGRCISLMGKPLPSTLNPPQQRIPDVACKMYIAHDFMCAVYAKQKASYFFSKCYFPKMNKRTSKHLT